MSLRGTSLCLARLALAALAAGANAHAACTLNAVAVLPIREAGRSFVFTAKVNGNPAALSIQTGTDTTTFDLSAADRLGVDLHPSDRNIYGVGGARKAYYGRAARVEIGGMVANDLTVRGHEVWPAAARAGIDGQLGMDLMAAYDIDLDIAGQHVVVYEADGACRKPNVALQPPLYMVNLVNINRDRQADVDVIVEGKHFRALLDSGLGHTSMFRSAALRLGLRPDFANDPGHAVEHGAGPFDVAYVPHVFKSMQIGDLQFNNTSLRILDQNGTGIDRHRVGSLLEQEDLTGGHEIILGQDFMRKVHLWISHSSQTLIMQYPPQPSVLPH